MKRFLVIIFVLQAFSALAQDEKSSPSTHVERKIERSYSIGVPLQAYVGERMLRVQDYFLTEIESGANQAHLMADRSFSVKAPFVNWSIEKDAPIEVTGQVMRKGRAYRLVKLPAPEAMGIRLLVDADGAFDGSAVSAFGGMRMGWKYKITPNEVRLVTAPPMKVVETSKGFTNYELLYGGTTGDSFQITYREYTKDDLARPAFSQTVVYDKKSKAIRFRNLAISVEEATNEAIRFAVTSD